MPKKISIGLGIMLAAGILPLTALAHVTVKPATAGIAAFQTFVVSVPVEKDIPTVAIRLVVPEGLNFVTPTVKPGWKIDVKKQKTGKEITDDDGMTMEEERVTEISWTGGSIPAGQRDEFSFSAQVPAQAGSVSWKAYQTYKDGSVVSWDKPRQDKYEENTGPYSETQIVNDLGAPSAKSSSLPSKLSLVSLIISISALVKAQRRE